jgi:deoxycitidine kinase
MYAFSSRLRHQRWVPHKEITKYLFMERSMESDKHIFAKNCYVQGFMNKLEYTIYQDLHAYWTEQAPRLDAIVYLKTSADICHERLVRRNRGEESTVSLEYL